MTHSGELYVGVMAIRGGGGTSGIRNVGQIAFLWINNSEKWDFRFYARRVFEFRGFDTRDFNTWVDWRQANQSYYYYYLNWRSKREGEL